MDVEDYSYGDTVDVVGKNGVLEAEIIDVDIGKNRLTLELE